MVDSWHLLYIVGLSVKVAFVAESPESAESGFPLGVIIAVSKMEKEAVSESGSSEYTDEEVEIEEQQVEMGKINSNRARKISCFLFCFHPLMPEKYFCTSIWFIVFKIQMLQAANTDLFNPLVPKAHNSG